MQILNVKDPMAENILCLQDKFLPKDCKVVALGGQISVSLSLLLIGNFARRVVLYYM